MICPNCKAKYQEGFVKCSNCDVDLVSSDKLDTTITGNRINLNFNNKRKKSPHLLDVVIFYKH